MSTWLKAVQSVARALGAILTQLRRIPLVDEAFARIQAHFFDPVVVRRIRRPIDRDLDVALQLYEKRIPEEERFQPDDIIRWLREDIACRKSRDRPTDWFLVAKYKRRVCGFILFHYFPLRRIAFIGYMVVGKTPGTPLENISFSLCAKVARLLKTEKRLSGCKMLLLEVDDPRRTSDRKARAESLARIVRFSKLAEMQSFSIRALDIQYRQPKLALNDDADAERPLLLLCALTPPNVLASQLRRETVQAMLSFIYVDLYPEGFSTDDRENEQYRRYCSEVRDKAVHALTDPVPSISCAELVSQIRNKERQQSRRSAQSSDRHTPIVGLS